MRSFRIVVLVAILLLALGPAIAAPAPNPQPAKGRIVVLMVWDGLRPDFVTRERTPNLYWLEHAGVEFAHQHAVFPTLTMANAAALATGTGPGGDGIYGDTMYFASLLQLRRLGPDVALAHGGIKLENSRNLVELNSNRAFDGRLLGLETLAQQVVGSGGYLAIIGKEGPTFLFDDSVAHSGERANANYLFVSDNMTEPPSAKIPTEQPHTLDWKQWQTVSARDGWFTDLVISKALPAAKADSIKGKDALIVFWQHDPDLVQHASGLGTAPALHALSACDRNLGRIRAAIDAYGVANQTNLMVVSDHGFSTIFANVSLADLLVAAGLKRSRDSSDVVIARNGGADLLYLSREAFQSPQARQTILQRIVDYIEAQPWCGPLFSRRPANSGETYAGWIKGTFSQRILGLYNPARSPDLIISFRAFPEQSNRGLTGSHNPGVTIGGPYAGRHGPNRSAPLLHPVRGVIYSDSADLSDPDKGFTTGMGMHGAAGARDLHNFCAVVGPDFRRNFVDTYPSGNSDIEPTLASVLHQPLEPGVTGRILREAMADQAAESNQQPRPITISSQLRLPGEIVTTKLSLTRYEGRDYLDGSSVAHSYLGHRPAPQRIDKIPLDESISPALHALEFSRIFDRPVIGPSQYPWPMYEAFNSALAEARIPPDAENPRIFVSGIPIALSAILRPIIGRP